LMRCGRAVPFTTFKWVGSGLRPAMIVLYVREGAVLLRYEAFRRPCQRIVPSCG